MYAMSDEKMKGCDRFMRSAIVVGATGLVGSILVKLLCESEEYVSVTAITRRPLDFKHPKLVVKVRSFDLLEEKDIDFAHEIFCCLGTTMKKAKTKEQFEKVDVEYPLHIASLAKKRGIMHFIFISAAGANSKSLFYYNRVKGKVEEELTSLRLPQLSIIRPSLLVGNRTEFRLKERVGGLLLKILKPILIGPLKNSRPIHAEQVALAMKYIALYGKTAPVNTYYSSDLAKMKMPEAIEEEEEEIVFNWDKLNK